MTVTAKMSHMRDRGNWDDRDALEEHLAQQLLGGSLAVVLGAGVSGDFKLPDWDVLVQRLYDRVGVTRPGGLKNEMAAEQLLHSHFKTDRVKFASAVREVLYEGADLALHTLQNNRALAALGTLVMASSRGSVSRVITFNFDDVLELYLRYYGHDVDSLDVMPSLNSNADVTVYHPHGLLPSDMSQAVERGIVFAQDDYDKVIGNAGNAWQMAIQQVFASHICIFIGLSGDDYRLSQIMHTVQSSTHPACAVGDRFWGVRLGLTGDARAVHWEQRGVYQCNLANYAEIPDIIFSVCQRAALSRRSDRDR
jgi:SIR2-like domain